MMTLFFSVLILTAQIPVSFVGSDEVATVTVRVSVSRSSDDATLFDGTLLMSVRDDSRMADVFLRLAGRDGQPADFARLDSETAELNIPSKDLFPANAQESHLRLLVYSPRYATGRDVTFVRAGENSIEARIVMESRDAYRQWAKRDDRRPKLSVVLREDARSVDPVLHRELREQMERDAAVEERLEKEESVAKNTPLGLILPAYIYPPNEGAVADKSNRLAQLNAADWKAIEQAVPELSKAGIRSLIVFNPWIDRNATVVPEYRQKIEVLRRSGATPIGYVSLGGGTGAQRWYEPAEVVLQRIRDWKRLYPDIQGFFFDVCPTSREQFAHVEQLAAFARQQFPGATIVLNPGTVPDSLYMSSSQVDVICTCETNHGAGLLNKLRMQEPVRQRFFGATRGPY